jgi:hypothetical protein
VMVNLSSADNEFEVPFTIEEGERKNTKEDLFDPIQGPLCNRAWAFQERLLSPAILHFARNRMVWECNEVCIMEEGWVPFPTFPVTKGLGATAFLARRPKGQDIFSATWFSKWTRIVEEFSQKLLTIEEDRLPAIDGVAKFMATRLGSRYFCGLWEKYFLEGLLWSSQFHVSQDITVHSGPSWSWASVGQRITYNAMDEGVLKPAATAISVEANTAAGEGYGKVIDATVTIEGTIYKYDSFVPILLAEIDKSTPNWLHKIDTVKNAEDWVKNIGVRDNVGLADGPLSMTGQPGRWNWEWDPRPRALPYWLLYIGNAPTMFGKLRNYFLLLNEDAETENIFRRVGIMGFEEFDPISAPTASQDAIDLDNITNDGYQYEPKVPRLNRGIQRQIVIV